MALAGNWTAVGAQTDRITTLWRGALAGIFVLSVAVYWGSLSGKPISDDIQHLTGFSIGGGTIWGALTQPFFKEYYRPLTSLSYCLDLQLYGPNPTLWHQTSIIIHSVTAVLVAILGFAVTKRRDAAACAGVFFAVQPAQVGAAAWIGGRTDILSALLVTSFFIALVSFLTSGNKLLLPCAALFLFLACAAKEQNAALLLVVPVLERAFGVHSKRRAVETGAWALAALAAFGALWVVYHPHIDALAGQGLEQSVRRVLLAYLHYLSLLFAPNPLALTCFSVNPYGWIGLIPAAGLLLATPYAVSKGYRFDLRFGAILLCFLLLYLPVSNIITIPSTQVAPYRIANSSVLIAVLLGWAAALCIRSKRWVPGSLLGANLAASLGATLWVISRLQNGPLWWSTCMQYDPHCRTVVRNTAAAFVGESTPDGYRTALGITDTYLNWLFQDSTWRTPLEAGTVPVITPSVQGRLGEAIGGQIDPNVLLAQAYNMRGVALAGLHDDRDALESYFVGFNLSSPNGFPEGIASILMRSDPAKALQFRRRAAAAFPSFDNLFNCGNALRRAGDNQSAVEYLQKAIQADPTHGDGWVALGLAEGALDNRDQAIACLESAEKLQTKDSRALKQLERIVQSYN